MKLLKWIGLVVIALLVVIQVYRPSRTNPITDESKSLFSTAQVPPEVKAVLERSCIDCHSNKTRWPWYSNVAPASWLLVDHVNEGREEFSISEWGNYPVKKADEKLEELCEMVEKGEMPLKSYLLIHRDAVLSESDRAAICQWATQERARIKASQAN